MNILTLFCNIDDFFLAHEKWQAKQCLPKEIPPGNTRVSSKTASERGDDDPHRLSSKWVSGPSSIFTKDMSASIGMLSFHIW